MAKADKGAKRPGHDEVRHERRREHWKNEPDEHDYPAAKDYLSLLLGEAEAARVVERLRRADVTHRKAKDLLRASRLALLDADNVHVADDLRKIRRGERLSPVLLVRGSLLADVALTVADGYHRICASYHVDENADIPCRMAAPVTRRRDATPTTTRSGVRPRPRSRVGIVSADGAGTSDGPTSAGAP